MEQSIYNFSVEAQGGESLLLENFKGKVLLIVNTASNCGFTNQYEELQSLYQENVSNGFEVLAFPCNQFGRQEPEDNKTIRSFCLNKYSISFYIFDKIKVNGPQAHPLFKYLCHEKPGILGFKDIKWNFTKFLISRKGLVLNRYAPNVSPLKIKEDIKKALKTDR
tara:strand:- start:222 stop:716 length:495 start_codon:yes stop_codon:yes gene_type:complete